MQVEFKPQKMPAGAVEIDPTMRAPNLVCESGSPHWYVSYNPITADYGCDTTALVLGQMEYFLVLKGDHRAEFAKILAEGSGPENKHKTRLALCLWYVRQHEDELHPYSDEVI